MQTKLRCMVGAMMAAAIVCLGALSASAQPLVWNPPCANVTVINNTACTVTLNLGTVPAGSIAPITAAPCAIVTAATAVLPFTINSVTTQAGAVVPMVSPGGIPPTPFPTICSLPISGLPADGQILGVTLPTGCCVDLFFYSTGDPSFPCTIFVHPHLTGPCIP